MARFCLSLAKGPSKGKVTRLTFFSAKKDKGLARLKYNETQLTVVKLFKYYKNKIKIRKNNNNGADN